MTAELTLADYADAEHAPRSVDPGCYACGTCMCHDGCADEQNPLKPGDCEVCGACSGCIEDCKEAERLAKTTGGTQP